MMEPTDFENDGSRVPANKKLPSQGAIFVGEEGSMLLGHINGTFLSGSVYDKLKADSKESESL